MGGAGNAENGKKVFIKCCAQCHTTEKNGKVKVGPPLFGIIGRKSGTFPNYHYSEILKTTGATWNDDSLHQYLENPKKFMPGNKMTFGGLKKAEDINDVIAYLKTLH